MDENNSMILEQNEESTGKGKMQSTSHDATSGLGKNFGGSRGGSAFNYAPNTKTGQTPFRRGSNGVARQPFTKGNLARNHSGVKKAMPKAHGIIDKMGNSSVNGTNNSNNTSNNSSFDSNSVSDAKDEKDNKTFDVSALWNKMPLGAKLSIIGSICGFLFFLLIFLVIITALMNLGIM